MPIVRTAKSAFYNAILSDGRIDAPLMKEVRRDLDRAYFSSRLVELAN